MHGGFRAMFARKRDLSLCVWSELPLDYEYHFRLIPSCHVCSVDGHLYC